MESKSVEENPVQNQTKNEEIKPKIDWTFLNDIESLINEFNNKGKLRCIVFDTETTGLNYKKDHILELAAVEVEDFKLTSRIMHIYIKPRVFVPKNVQELNHIRYDDYQNYWEYYNQDTKAQLQKFLDFIGNDAYIIAHNATFDYYFLMNELKYWGLSEIPKERFRCTLRIVKKLFKSKGIELANNKLITLCDYFQILVNQNEGSFHNGLFDTIMTSKLLIHLYKNFANINDYVPYKYKKKEKNDKKEEKNINEITDKINNINLENKKENNISNNKEVKKENNNKIESDKKNGNEMNLLIKKMNEMCINKDDNKDKITEKKDQKEEEKLE